ncbi:MAG: hypothetical protein JW821_14365 [Deltaproteobacteria bacterium]|nr:hypothetical protein [Deltaproteobacteria bacterium]
MASNFTIRFQRRNGDLHIHLNGDFDGTSAHVLLNALERNVQEEQRIYVNTAGLKDVAPFGREVLQANLSVLKANSDKIVFIGKDGAAFTA